MLPFPAAMAAAGSWSAPWAVSFSHGIPSSVFLLENLVLAMLTGF